MELTRSPRRWELSILLKYLTTKGEKIYLFFLLKDEREEYTGAFHSELVHLYLNNSFDRHTYVCLQEARAYKRSWWGGRQVSGQIKDIPCGCSWSPPIPWVVISTEIKQWASLGARQAQDWPP